MVVERGVCGGQLAYQLGPLSMDSDWEVGRVDFCYVGVHSGYRINLELAHHMEEAQSALGSRAALTRYRAVFAGRQWWRCRSVVSWARHLYPKEAASSACI